MIRPRASTALGLYELAEKYDIPVVAQLASSLLQSSLRPRSGEPESPFPRHGIDLWKLADCAIRRGNSDLLRRCVATIAEPLEYMGEGHNACMQAPTSEMICAGLGGVLPLLIPSINDAVKRLVEKIKHQSLELKQLRMGHWAEKFKLDWKAWLLWKRLACKKGDSKAAPWKTIMYLPYTSARQAMKACTIAAGALGRNLFVRVQRWTASLWAAYKCYISATFLVSSLI